MSFFDDASLAFLPSSGAGKDGKAYSIKPTTGDGDFTFSRGSNLAATRVGADGLIEKGRENLLTYSNDFSQSVWNKSSASVTSGQSGYDGSNDAWLLEATGAYARMPQSVSSSGVQTYSVYAKANTTDFLLLRCNIGGNQYAIFNLSDGTIPTLYAGFISGNATSVGNGWYRVSLLFNGSLSEVAIGVSTDGTIAGWDDTTNESIYIQDAQLEQGLAATDYIESGATTGKAGLLEDEPRFDYSGGATCPSLLLEPSRTNLVQSEYFGAWSIIGSPTITSNYGTSPEGLQNSTRIEGVDGDRIYIGISGSSATYTYSIYAKGSGDIKLRDNSGSYNLNISLSSNWQRYDYSFTASFTNIQIQIDSTTDAEIWGAQLEEGSYPTSYIPNHSGGSVTRGVDSCTGAGDSSTFNSTEGVLYAEISALEDLGTARRYISLSDGSSNNDLRLYFNNSVGTIVALSKVGGVTQFSMFGGGYDLTEAHKIAVKYKVNDFALWIDGVEVDTDSSGLVNAPNTFDELAFNGNGLPFFGKAKQVLTFNTALSDADLATLTT